MTFADRAGYEVVGLFKETGSGLRVDRRKVIALAQARKIDAVPVTELLTRLVNGWPQKRIDELIEGRASVVS